MQDLQNVLNGLFGPRRRSPKTKLVAIYPNGSTYTITKRGREWWWKEGRGSFPLASAIENVQREGGRVERRGIDEPTLPSGARIKAGLDPALGFLCRCGITVLGDGSRVGWRCSACDKAAVR